MFSSIEISGAGPSSRTYALSDMHGRLDLFDAAIAWIRSDCAGHSATVVLGGDYIDFGPDSRGMLDRVIELVEEEEPLMWLPLLGNHEHMMLAACRSRSPVVWEKWVNSGGGATLQNFDSGTAESPKIDWKAMEPYLRFMEQSMLTWVIDEHRIFVHAGLRDIGRGNWTLRKQDLKDLLWIRPKAMDPVWPSRLKKLLVHGHTPFDPGVPGKRFCLDGGVGKSGGGLKVVRFDAGQREPSQIEYFRGQ